MRKNTKVQLRPQSRRADKVPMPGTCGRPAERECGMRDPLGVRHPRPAAAQSRGRQGAVAGAGNSGGD
jgi:hypothetical protein